jgi:hypothetical protein
MQNTLHASMYFITIFLIILKIIQKFRIPSSLEPGSHNIAPFPAKSITIVLKSTSSRLLSCYSPSLLMAALLDKLEGVCILPRLSESMWKCQSY